MAKSNKKSKNGGGKGKKHVGKHALLGTFAGGVLGKVVERILADTIQDFVAPGKHKHAKKEHANGHEDVAGKLLAAVAEGGAKSVPQLLAETQLKLSDVLHALQSLRDFRLINFVGEPGEETVEVTRSGANAATAIRSNDIRKEAAHLLEC